MIQFARDGRGAVAPLAPGGGDHPPDKLNAGQKLALTHLCEGRDRVMLLGGVAGAGKTRLLTELKKQVEGRGKRILAFAPSAEASRGVLRESGFGDAETVAMLLKNPKTPESIRDQVVLVDEAGLLGTPAMAKLFDVAKQMNARLILAGDRHQHRAVERGPALRLLEEEAGIRSATLTEIVRQKDRYSQAVAYLSQGRVESGFRTLEELRWVHEVADPQMRYDRIAAEYVQGTEAGQSVLVVSPTHAEASRVTQAIRSALRGEGQIGPDVTRALKLTNRNLTLAQRRDGVNYTEGDVVLFTQNAVGFKKGTRLKVGVDPIPLHLAERFAVFQAGELPLAAGDKVRITANGSTADGHTVSNGQVFGVRRIAGDGTLVLDNGWRLGPTFGQIDYGYCSTSHASQGKTKDRVIVAESSESFPAASVQQFYVSVSRGRTHCSVYTDDKEGLVEAVGGTGDNLSATELAGRTIGLARRMQLGQAYRPEHAIQPEREVRPYDR